MKLKSGSSAFFVVTAVIFRDNGVAMACDKRIESLKLELGFPEHKEFHFNGDSEKIRLRFLAEVARFEFQYTSLVLNKSGLSGPGFQIKESLGFAQQPPFSSKFLGK